MLALRNVLQSETGKIVLSMLWGFGLACLFQRACKGRNCIIYKAPPPSDVQKQVFRFGGKCYKYTPHAVSCNVPADQLVPPEEFSCRRL